MTTKAPIEIVHLAFKALGWNMTPVLMVQTDLDKLAEIKRTLDLDDMARNDHEAGFTSEETLGFIRGIIYDDT